MGYVSLIYEFIFFELNEQNLEQVCNQFSKILAKALNILDIQKNIQTLLANQDDGDEEAMMAATDE